jgi:hypothetical protein
MKAIEKRAGVKRRNSVVIPRLAQRAEGSHNCKFRYRETSHVI